MIEVNSNGLSIADGERWVADGAEETRRVDFPLTLESVVFDVGGYFGNWTVALIKRLNFVPNIFIFEPVDEFYNSLVMRFENNPRRIRVLPIALGDHDEITTLRKAGSASSLLGDHRYEKVELVDIASLVDRLKLEKIDLISINIEGAEYALLERMIESGLINRCEYVQVQFHHLFEGAERRRALIREGLAKTHEEIYCYDFVWEAWRRRSSPCT